MRANVLLAAESLTAGNGGVARVARLMAKVLAEQVAAGRLRGSAVVLSDRQAAQDCGLSVRSVAGSRPRFLWHVQAATVRHSHFLYDFLGMARAHCRFPGLRRPALSYIHGVEVWENTFSNRLRAARQVGYLLSNTQYTRDRAERIHGGFARARVCWLGTETDDPAPAPAGEGRPTVVVIGRMDELAYKGHRELIEAWPKIVSCVPEARLLIVGDGPSAATMKHMAARTPGADRIEFRGFIAPSAMADVWAEASVFAMPSRGEGFGLVYIEAMRHGVPVVASAHDAAPEINLDGETGYNVNLENPDELPDRLIGLLRDPALARKLGRQGQARWAEHFCYNAFRKRFLPLLDEFLDGGCRCS